jgi:hypothetical protein
MKGIAVPTRDALCSAPQLTPHILRDKAGLNPSIANVL